MSLCWFTVQLCTLLFLLRLDAAQSNFIPKSALPEKVIDPTNDHGTWILNKNMLNEDVTTLDSGLQYKVLKKGSGSVLYHPKNYSMCSCHYTGTTPGLTQNATQRDESEWTSFDSSKNGKPAVFAPSSMVQGFAEAMTLMSEGDKWEIVLPAKLGYGDAGSPPKVLKGDALIFRLELLEIKSHKVKGECTMETRAACDASELELIAKWENKPSAEIEKYSKSLRKKKAITLGIKDQDALWAKMEVVDKIRFAAKRREIIEKEEAAAKKKKEKKVRYAKKGKGNEL